jgi:hypothetical protein
LAVSAEDGGASDLNVFDYIKEKDVETVMPKELNESIAVLRGEFKGEIGKMLSRDRKKDEVVIQVGLTEIIKVSQDECSATAQIDS